MNSATINLVAELAATHGWSPLDDRSSTYPVYTWGESAEITVDFHRGHGGVNTAILYRSGRRIDSVSTGSAFDRLQRLQSWLREQARPRQIRDLFEGVMVGGEYVTKIIQSQIPGNRTVALTGGGYISGNFDTEVAEPGESSPRAEAEFALMRVDRARQQAQDRYNKTLPELPADIVFVAGDGQQAACPVEDCDASLSGYADTTERSPVLGWHDGDLYGTVQTGVPHLILGDYEYGDDSTEIHSIRCWRGHAFQVPEHTDRDV